MKIIKVIKVLSKIISIVLFIAYFVMIYLDYKSYHDYLNSAPFYIFVLVRSVEFLLPGIILFVFSHWISKNKPN